MAVPSIPAGASTVTKIIFTIAAFLAAAGASVWIAQSDPALAADLTGLAVLATTFGGIIHTVWDHSP